MPWDTAASDIGADGDPLKPRIVFEGPELIEPMGAEDAGQPHRAAAPSPADEARQHRSESAARSNPWGADG